MLVTVFIAAAVIATAVNAAHIQPNNDLVAFPDETTSRTQNFVTHRIWSRLTNTVGTPSIPSPKFQVDQKAFTTGKVEVWLQAGGAAEKQIGSTLAAGFGTFTKSAFKTTADIDDPATFNTFTVTLKKDDEDNTDPNVKITLNSCTGTLDSAARHTIVISQTFTSTPESSTASPGCQFPSDMAAGTCSSRQINAQVSVSCQVLSETVRIRECDSTKADFYRFDLPANVCPLRLVRTNGDIDSLIESEETVSRVVGGTAGSKQVEDLEFSSSYSLLGVTGFSTNGNVDNRRHTVVLTGSGPTVADYLKLETGYLRIITTSWMRATT